MTKFKTLKDIEKNPKIKINGIGLFEDMKYIKEHLKPLGYSEEKTEIYIESECVKIADLKQEAIKWIKHIEKDIEEITKLEWSKNQSPIQFMAVKGLPQELQAQITWIKMFFNITDKELI
jgi:hypothetical protein